MNGGCAGTGAGIRREIELDLGGSSSLEADGLSWGNSETGSSSEVRQHEKTNVLLEPRDDISLAALEDLMVIVDIEGTFNEDEAPKALQRRTEGATILGKSKDEQWCLRASAETGTSLDARVDSPTVAKVDTLLRFANPVGTTERKATSGAGSGSQATVAFALPRDRHLVENTTFRLVAGRAASKLLVVTGSSGPEACTTVIGSSNGEGTARRPGLDNLVAGSVSTAQSTTCYAGPALGMRSIRSRASSCELTAPEVATANTASACSGTTSQKITGLVKATCDVGDKGARTMGVDDTWHRHYSSLLAYFKETGECCGMSRILRKWLTVQRKRFHDGELEPWKVAALNCAGVNWMVKTQESTDSLESIKRFEQMGEARRWKHGFDKVKAFYDQYGHLHYFHAVVKEDSTHDFDLLTRWDLQQRVEHKKYLQRQPTSMIQGRVDLLSSIHFFDWQSQYEWNRAFDQVLAFFNKHGHLVFDKEAYCLRKVKEWRVWSAKQRRDYERLKNGHDSKFLTSQRVHALNSIGFFHAMEKQMYRFFIARLKLFRETSGSCCVLTPENYEDATGDREAAMWLKAQREEYCRFIQNPDASYLTGRALQRLSVLGVDLTSELDKSRTSSSPIHTAKDALCKAVPSSGELSVPAAPTTSYRSRQRES
jgi:Helicase associated domain